MTSIRSAFGSSGSADQRTASQETMAIPTSDTVYTFSLTTDWFQTVNEVAPINAAAVAIASRSHFADSQRRRIWLVTRNHIAADAALDTAASTLMRAATFGAIGNNENTRPTTTKNGLPGGCGNPKVYAAAMYSLVSHIAVEGAIVTRYSARTASPAIAAARYGGASPALSFFTRRAVPRSPSIQISAGISTQ